MLKTKWKLILLCLFVVFPLFAQGEETNPEEINLQETNSDETNLGETAPAPTAERAEAPSEETGRSENRFLRLFSDTRRPLIPSDNLVFGLPEKLDFAFGFDLGYEDATWFGMGIRVDYSAGPLRLVADMDFKNDQKYAPAAVMLPSGNLGGFYFMLNEGGISYDKDALHFTAGRFRSYDEIDSPYTLFLNSEGISANTLKFRWQSSHFIYQTQWIGLNWNSAISSPAWNEYARRKQAGNWYAEKYPLTGEGDIDGLAYGFPDRGVNYKIYALKANDWRFGLLDAAVYSNRYFDPEYLLSPIPMYFTQYFRATAGRPWATEQNDNCLIGFFWDLKKSKWDVYVQALVDDFSLGFMRWFYHDFSRNPWKAAWALGGRIQTPIGRFGFHHGGALKYTFEPIGTSDEGRYKNDSAATAYGYTYYPETRYYDGDDTVSLLIQDTMVGYKHGENNVAFQVDYRNSFAGYMVNAELELVLAGANSPANPWHDYDSRSSMYKNNIDGAAGGYGSQLLNDRQIERMLEFRVNVSRRFGPFIAYSALALGGRFNKLVLRPANNPDSEDRTIDDNVWIWKASGSHELIFRFSIGFRYAIPVL